MPEREPDQVHAGLPMSGPAEILLDCWGIPHIYAGNAADAFFAQGFNAARDRLWQLDVWRRQGLGLLAEAFGPGYIARDRAARLFLYRGPMDTERAAYGCELEGVLGPFVAGINEYIKLTARHRDLLPVEFQSLGYQPGIWHPDDVLRIRSHGLFRNVGSEVTRARILHEFGPEADALRELLDPATELTVPAGLDLSLITSDVLRDYTLATTPPDLSSLRPDGRSSGDRRFGDRSLGDLSSVDRSFRDLGAPDSGSNNWAISGRRTASGRPIMASDPHRAVTAPSLRYLAHLVCPEFSVIGGGEPALPGISVGHNGRAAFSFTVFPADQEDLYVYETDVAGSRYRYRDGWEPMQVISEAIPVRGGDPVEVELKFTRHGPVVHETPRRQAAFSVRAAWLEPGMAPYLASVGLMRAGDWEEFRAAAASWGAPGENMIYADVAGTIGWQPSGVIPVRRNWDGLLPVPGDGRYEWDGFVTAADLPFEVNPDRGWLATANQRNVEPDQAGGVQVGFEWAAPFRYQRIAEVLENDRPATVADSAALQSDYVSIVARRLIGRLIGPLSSLPGADPRAARAAAMLSGWDCRMAAGSAPAALFEVWFRSYLRPALFSAAIGGQVPDGELSRALEILVNQANVTGDARIVFALIEQASASPEARSRLDAIVESTLTGAMLDLEDVLGTDATGWQWGALHRASLRHPLADRLSAVGGDLDRLGPQPRGGCGDTVGCTAYGSGGLEQASGATMRMVLDVGDWDSSLAMNSPGQAADPASPHYADLYAAWARDESFPLLYSRPRIADVTDQRILLTP
jgi:penicillin G amidase